MMAGAWKWYATTEGATDEYSFESNTREDAISAIIRDLGHSGKILVCEARMSSAAKYEGADFVPFVSKRNEELIDVGELPAARKAKS